MPDNVSVTYITLNKLFAVFFIYYDDYDDAITIVARKPMIISPSKQRLSSVSCAADAARRIAPPGDKQPTDEPFVNYCALSPYLSNILCM